MPAEMIEDAIYAQLHIAAQQETSPFYGALFQQRGVRGQEIAIRLSDGTERYLYIRRNQQQILWPAGEEEPTR